MMLPQNHQETSPKHNEDQLSDSSQHTSNPDHKTPRELADDDIARKVGKWTIQEDDLLRKYVPLFGEKQWRKISEYIPGRTSIQCLHRWTKILKPGLVKGPWTAEEDQKLQAWVRAEGPTKWAQCANFINGRSGKQCRERWFNNLNPNVKKGNWAKEEDELIFELYQKYGSSWSKIAKFIPGRTENAIKNRFYSTLRKLTSDKKKDQPESHEDLCLQDDKEEKLDVPVKCVRDLSVPAQAPNALYMLLNGKTSAVGNQENIKKEDLSDEKKNGEKTVSKMEVQQQKQAFNINGEKMVVVRDIKPGNERNIQEAANKLFSTEIEDNDTAFEDFLSSLQVNLKDDFLRREFEPTKKPDDISHLDDLQKKVLNFCQTNIKDLAETFKAIEPNRASTTASEISTSDARARPAPQFHNSSVTLESSNLHQEPSNLQGTILLTQNPSVNSLQKGFSLRLPQNKTEGQGSSPAKGQSPKGFSLYNPLKPLNKNSRNASENSSDKQSPNLGGKQLKPLHVPGTLAEIEGKMSVEKGLPMQFGGNAQQGFMGAGNAGGVFPKLSSAEMQETEKRMVFLFQQLFSLETLLAKTRNDLVQFESCLKVGKGVGQENMTSEDLNVKRGLEYIQRPFERINPEFEEILKKKKVE